MNDELNESEEVLSVDELLCNLNTDDMNELKEVLTRVLDGVAAAFAVWMRLREKYGSEDRIQQAGGAQWSP